MGQIRLTVSLVMIGLFTIALIGFAINFAEDNNAPIDIRNDPEINSLYSNTNQNVSGFDTDSQNQYESILETTIAPDSGGTATSTGPFAVTPANSIGVVSNILEVGYIKIFGSNSGFGIFFTALTGILFFMMGLFLYKTLRGLPD